MFWGLVVQVGSRYKQDVEQPFQISTVSLELPDNINASNSPKGGDSIRVFVEYKNEKYLLAHLSGKQGVLQSQLGVRFEKNCNLAFWAEGMKRAKVHLVGYYLDHSDLSLTSSSSMVTIPVTGQQVKSILVHKDSSSSATNTKVGKRVSIKENEKEMEESEEDDETEDDDDDENAESSFYEMINGDGKNKIKFADNEDEEGEEEEEDDDDEDDSDEEDADDDFNDIWADEEAEARSKIKNQNEKKRKLEEDDSAEIINEDGDEEDDDDDAEEDSEETSDESDSNTLQQIKKLKAELSKQGELKPKNKNSNKKEQDASNQSGNSSSSASTILKTPESVGKFKTPDQSSGGDSSHNKTPSSIGNTPMKHYSKGGVLIQELKVGTGPVCKKGNHASVYYTGRLKTNNKQFDSCTSGPGFKFKVGKGDVIRGWEFGLEGMKQGGKRRLVIPPNMGYGREGAMPEIPPNSTLVFDIELKRVN